MPSQVTESKNRIEARQQRWASLDDPYSRKEPIESDLPLRLPTIAKHHPKYISTRDSLLSSGGCGAPHQERSHAQGPEPLPPRPGACLPKIIVDTPNRGGLSPLVQRPRRHPRRRTARCLRSGAPLLLSHILAVGRRMGTMTQSLEAWDRCSPRLTIRGSGARGSPGVSPPLY
jgi:hypothetical protein